MSCCTLILALWYHGGGGYHSQSVLFAKLQSLPVSLSPRSRRRRHGGVVLGGRVPSARRHLHQPAPAAEHCFLTAGCPIAEDYSALLKHPNHSLGGPIGI